MSLLERELLNRRMPPTVPNQRSNVAKSGQKSSRSRSDYSPLQWNQYFESKRDVKVNDDSFRVYMNGLNGNQTDDSNTPLLVCLPGGGFSGLTFGPFAQEIQQLCECRLIAVDLRGHGNTQTTNDEDLSAQTLTNDVFNIITSLFTINTIPPLILLGHSMGGAIAVHCATALEELMPRIVGLIVIDVVEGTALDALHSMQSFLRSRPKSFPTLENAIEWCVRSGQTRNVEAARLSMPGQLKNISSNRTATSELESKENDCLTENTTKETTNKSIFGFEGIKEVENEDNVEEVTNDSEDLKTAPISGYTWRIDLSLSEPFWYQWFQDLSNMFLNSTADAKLLLLAGVDRLDRVLTVGQMQGKFQMQVLPRCGHTVHEDVPDKVAQVVANFLIRNRFTLSKTEFERPFPSC